MGYNGMLGDTTQMRGAADAIAAAKPVTPDWGVSPIPAQEMQGVIALNNGCNDAVNRSTGFVDQAEKGFDLFSEILRLCANDYDQADAAGAQAIAHSSAASLDHINTVNHINGIDFFDHISATNRPGETDFVLPPSYQGVK